MSDAYTEEVTDILESENRRLKAALLEIREIGLTLTEADYEQDTAGILRMLQLTRAALAPETNKCE